MKLQLLLFTILGLAFCSIEANAQAKQYTMFEHFTQASCGPCATQNPAFQSVYVNNIANVHHVAYHTSWPGTDPMNAINPVDVQAMVTLYTVTGVPDMIHDGTSVGSPTAVSQNLIDRVGSSPIRILVDHTLVGDTVVTGTITIETVGDKPAETYVLRVMAIEQNISYTAPPGSNGEREFPNVFRQFVLGGTTGMVVDLPESGEAMTINFTYPIDAAWDAQQMYSLAYVQSTGSDKVINSGASIDPVYNIVNWSEDKFKNANSQETAFEGNIYSTADNAVIVTITTDAGAEWEHEVIVGGSAVESGDTIMLVAGDVPVTLTVDPGTVSDVARYSISINEPGTNAAQQLSYYIINNVTDLVIVSDNAASGSIPVDFGAPYIAGLEAASTVEKASMGHTFYPDAESADALEDVENIYYSIGWSFPALTDDVTRALIKHLNRGGNLMIAGQDVGWDIMSMHSASNGTALQRIFYTDYLQANFIGDGSSTNSQFVANADDEVFGDVPATTVNMSVYTAGNTFPDEITANSADGTPIFSYSTTKTAGIKVETGDSKIVYLGIGLEQVTDPVVSDAIFGLTHDWFHGLVSTEYVDAAFAKLGNAFPNPASEFITIELGDVLKGNLNIVLTDVTGKTIGTQAVSQGSNQAQIDVTNLASGSYFYQLSNGTQITTAKKFVRQ